MQFVQAKTPGWRGLGAIFGAGHVAADDAAWGDLGGITSARSAEMILPIWLHPYMSLKSPMLNFKIAE
jgi:hypothetical protein